MHVLLASFKTFAIFELTSSESSFSDGNIRISLLLYHTTGFFIARIKLRLINLFLILNSLKARRKTCKIPNILRKWSESIHLESMEESDRS